MTRARSDVARAVGPSDGSAQRLDIEGLRGVAIALVVLYHAGVPLPGGFVGVDVFLVISGFLITGLLLREVDRTGSVSLARFYARRIRRLLPAAAVVLAVTAVAAAIVLPPVDLPQALGDGASAVLSVANLRFAAAAGDYFAAAGPPSPFLHFWSLSLEEQFYLVWPALLLLLAARPRVVRARRTRLAAGLALAVIVILGLAASAALTDGAAQLAFYGLPARAWQFAVGGLLAAGAAPIARIPSAVSAAAGWVGLAGLAASALLLDGSMAYPGLVALVPTLSAAALLLAGDTSVVGRLLAIPPLRFLGRISYSLYLWHWPILLLPVLMVGAPLDAVSTAALVALAVIAGWASRTFVELPFLRADGAQPRVTARTLRLGLTAMTVLAVSLGGFSAAASAALNAPQRGDQAAVSPVPSEAAPASDDPGPIASAGPSPSATPAERPAASPAPTPTAAPAPSGAPSPLPTPIPWTAIGAGPLDAGVHLPANVKPALAAARTDDERLVGDGCFTWLDSAVPARCVYGTANAPVTIVLIGDSHASAWFPALNALAAKHGWRLLPFVKASCPFVDAPVVNPYAKRTYTQCAVWRDAAIKAVNSAKPDLVIVGTAHHEGIKLVGGSLTDYAGQARAMAAAVRRLTAPVAILVDNPRTDTDIPGCLSRHRDDVNRCAIPASMAFAADFAVVETAAAQQTGAALLDVTSAICPSTPCPVVRGGMILFRDNHHLTATFARSLAPALDSELSPLLARLALKP